MKCLSFWFPFHPLKKGHVVVSPGIVHFCWNLCVPSYHKMEMAALISLSVSKALANDCL